MKKKIGFNDLSTSLKILVVNGWIIVGLFAVTFLVGFIQGILSV